MREAVESSMTRIVIAHTWNGLPAGRDEQIALEVEVAAEFVQLRVDAPWHGDELPASPGGPCDGLWEYEVVELFLLGAGDRHLELELGPGGHYLALELKGRRRRVRSRVPLEVRSEQRAQRWRAEARLPRRELPAGLYAWNAYAMHGAGAARRYLALQQVPGDRPDFHQLEHFAPLPESLHSALAR
jgi:hypothetical protein